MTATKSDSASMKLIGAPFTAFDSGGALDLGAVERQAAHMRETGLVGAFVAGTTGESSSLSVEERKQLMEKWRQHAGSLRLIAHVGSANLAEAADLAAHAQSIGVDAIGAVPPYYFRPASTTALVDAMAAIAEAAPNLPYFYYHIPVLTKVELPMAPVMEQAIERIPNFAGIKFTHSDMLEYAHLVEIAGNRYEVMFGRDPLLLFAMGAGGKAAVGSTYMFAASLYHDIIKAVDEGRMDDARRGTSVSREIVALCNRHGGLVAQKAIYSHAVVASGAARAPFSRLSETVMDEIKAFVDAGKLQFDAGR
jgi:N-acetylneuraminate lyase